MRGSIQRLIVPLLVLSIIGGLWWSWHLYKEPADQDPIAQEPNDAAEIDRDQVILQPDKLSAAKIEIGSAIKRVSQSQVVVPGRIKYDENHHVQVRSAASGIVIEMLHKPGDIVAQGQLLAIVSSPEIGSARADRMRRKDELNLADKQHTWAVTSFKGIQQIAKSIQSRMTPAGIRSSLGDTPVGSSGEILLSAYSNLLLTEASQTRITGVAATGAVSGRIVQERTTQFDSAMASLQANLQQTLFDAQQRQHSAAAGWDDARRRYQLACQQVATLLGRQVSADDGADDTDSASDLSQVRIFAPIQGTVEKRLLNATERVDSGDGLYIVANTSFLWVSADMREANWSKVLLAPGDKLSVNLPAFPDEHWEASVYYIGRELDPATNSIPLVASIDNSSTRLRPGLFAKISLPVSQPEQKLMVPESAIASHDGASFVFRPGDAGQFNRVDIEVGQEQQGWVEVKSGLQDGDRVVVQGTFALKSELLLESED